MLNQNKRLGIQYALLAGICASLSSVFGKLMTQPKDQLSTFMTRALFLLLNLMCTVLMIGLYTRSMHHLSTTEATIINSSTNLIFTALFGTILFDERLSLKWYMGSALITMGVALIMTGERKQRTIRTNNISIADDVTQGSNNDIPAEEENKKND
jgi:drug/metabolite transporter (DMT)-like permease